MKLFYKNAMVCSMMMDGPNRDVWQNPDAVIEEVITAPHLTVVDLGAGTGYFTALFSRKLARGKVLSLEPEPNLVDWLVKRKEEESLNNVTIHRISHADPKLNHINEEIDLIFIGYTYFHFEDPVGYFKERIHPFIDKKTHVIIADAAPEFPAARRKVPAGQVIAEMEEAGFLLNSAPPILDRQYLLIFKKA